MSFFYLRAGLFLDYSSQSVACFRQLILGLGIEFDIALVEDYSICNIKDPQAQKCSIIMFKISLLNFLLLIS